MKLRWVVVFCGVLAAMSAHAAPLRNQIEVRGADNVLYGFLVICDDCKSGQATAKQSCDPGAIDGWVAGEPCGNCLTQANWGTLVRFPYDLRIKGMLLDKDGKPIKDRFVKMMMPNGWGVRTRTIEDGSFRLSLGATEERKEGEPIEVDIGTWTDSVLDEKDEHFALYLMAPGYKKCTGTEPSSERPVTLK